MKPRPTRIRGALYSQLAWFIRLRWLAAAAVVAGALLDWQQLNWYGRAPWMVALGGVIFAYNAVLWAILRQPRVARQAALVWFSMVQILLDLVCLTLLVTWTGGSASPLLGFFVFHMVFASLLLPRRMAYLSAAAAMAMVAGGLWLSGQAPHAREERLVLIGWVVTLTLTVHLANRITRALRQQRARLRRKNRHIRAMSAQLRRQQETMIQHEKMVAMGHMAAGVAHEVANPLASMDSVLQLVQRRPERLRPEIIVTLREQVARIHQIIQQMKSFAHPAEGQRALLPLNDVVEQGLRMLSFDPRMKQVRIERQFAADAPAVVVIPQALHQVLVNLVQNALDAMEGCQDPMLTIRTSRRENEGVLEVCDTGHGIRSEDMSRLFEPFFTTKPVGKGTGLGLSISYSLVQKQGGSIAVRSQEGKGTTFTVRLATEAASRNREGDAGSVAVSEKPSV